jgi:hypothetical protein
LAWQERYDANVVRVHIEFVYDQAEMSHIIRGADLRSNVYMRFFLRALYWLLADASRGLGVTLARGLGVGINVHSSVIAALEHHGRLAEFSAGLPFVWAENNMKADHLYVSGPVLYDPRTIIDEQVEPHGLQGLLLGLDHLIEHYPEQRISPYTVLEDEQVRKWTRAIHLAGPGHDILRIHDREVEKILKKLADTPFRRPVRVVLDYSALRLLHYSFNDEVRLFCDTLEWISSILGPVVGHSGAS